MSTLYDEIQEVKAQYPQVRSAIIAPCVQVAVASSATNDGARKCTRHGLAPPSETR